MGETTSSGGVEHDALRVRFREVLSARGMSVSEAARQSGVANSTLAAWLAAKYTGDNARVAHQVELWLATREQETAARLAMPALPGYVETPTAEAFGALFGHAQYTPDIVTATGAPGVGKTSSAREYRRTHSNVWLLTADPSCASPFAILEFLAEVVGIYEPSPSRRMRAVVKKLQGTQGLLIVDEAQHLSIGALEQLRAVHDKAEIGLAYVGNEDVHARLAGGGRRAQFAQLSSRVGMRLMRQRPLAADVDALLAAAGIDGTAERKLLRAIASKPGALRSMSKVLRVAHMQASADETAIESRHLQEAWARLSDSGEITEAA